MNVIELNREEYLESVKKIEDFKTLNFSKSALEWWDNYYSWEKFPPLCLSDKKKHFCYLFYNISKDNEYLTIHNILHQINIEQKVMLINFWNIYLVISQIKI